MTGHDTPDVTPDRTFESDWARRRLAQVFGDVLPDTTRDERDPGTSSGGGDRRGEDTSDRWLREQVPPHHG